MSTENSTTEVQDTTPVEPTAAAQDASQERDFETEIAKLRKEAAKHRTEKNELKKQLGELAPIVEEFNAKKQAEMTELEKLQAEMQKLQQEKTAALNEAKRSKLMAYGLPETAAGIIDLNSLSWDDDDRLREQLQPFITPTKPQASTPGPAGGTPQQAINSIEDLRGMSQQEIISRWDSIKQNLTPKSSSIRL